jgi:hypothetical protein
VAYFVMMSSFEEFVADLFSLDDAWVATEASSRVGAASDLCARHGE